MRNWLVKKLGGYTSDEGYVSNARYDAMEQKAKDRAEVIEGLKKNIANVETNLRKSNAEFSEHRRKVSAEIDRIKIGWGKDLSKLEKITKDYDTQKRGYGRMKTRNFRARQLLKDMENSSTKGKGIKWFDYQSYSILGDKLLQLRNILDGERDNDSRKPKRSKFRNNKKK